jgi:hypothetical protein
MIDMSVKGKLIIQYIIEEVKWNENRNN